MGKCILTEMSGFAGQMMDEINETTSMYDSELAAKMTTSKTGLLARAPAYITRDLCWSMDVYCSVMRPLAKLHRFRTSEIKSVDQASNFQWRTSRNSIGITFCTTSATMPRFTSRT